MEVRAHNRPAINLFEKVGFRRSELVFLPGYEWHGIYYMVGNVRQIAKSVVVKSKINCEAVTAPAKAGGVGNVEAKVVPGGDEMVEVVLGPARGPV